MHSRNLLAVLITLSTLFSVSLFISACRSPVQGSRMKGGASVSFTITGLVPPSASSVTAARPSRMILPTTANLRVTVTGDDGFSRTESAAYSANAAVEIAGLPVDEELTFLVEALDAGGSAVTSWTGNRTLEKGSNALSATLVPDPAKVLSLSVDNATKFDIDAGASLPAGGVRIYALTFDSAVAGERQIVAVTGKARWLWMNAYDENWVPLDCVAMDSAQGWVVVNAAAGATVRVAVANAVSSPGYPAGTVGYELQARKATFVAPGAAGTGTSADPGQIGLMEFTNVAGDPESFFLREGVYGVVGGLYSEHFNIRSYGGFASGSWKTRSSASHPTEIVNTGSGETTLGLTYEIGGHCSLDALTITAGDLTDGAPTRRALSLDCSTASSLVVSNCVIRGSQSDASLTVSAASYGLAVGEATPEIASCTISGGIARSDLSDNNASAYACYLASGAAPYLHDCDIDGGNSYAYTDGETVGFFADSEVSGVTVVVAGCRVWGGTSSSSGNGAMESYAFKNWGADARFTVANSLVSAGSSTTNAVSSASCMAFYTTSNPFTIVGCAVDAGRSLPATAGSGIAVAIDVEYNAALSGTLAACVLFNSTDSGTGIKVAVRERNLGYGPSRITGNGVIGCAPFMKVSTEYTDFSASSSTYKTNTGIDAARSPALEFRSYSATVQTWAAFAESDWRPASSGAQIAGTSSGESPSDWGLTQTDFDNYPALLIDYAGNPRPRSGAWTRGAYQ